MPRRTLDPSHFLPGVKHGDFVVIGPDPDARYSMLCTCKCGLVKSVTRTALVNGTRTMCGLCKTKAAEIPSGARFGILTVVSDESSRRSHVIVKCDCNGCEYEINRYSLLDGTSRSCGCARIKFIIEVGQTYGRLTVVEKDDTNKRKWLCRCSCDGKIISVIDHHLASGHTKSCSCAQKDMMSETRATHGHTRPRNGGQTKEYAAWAEMIKRCEKPTQRHYGYYGGRGIKVCDRWRHSFEAFLEDMEYAPSSKHSLDRIDVDGDYEPGNVRWATVQEQAENKTTTIYVNIHGKRMKLVDVAREYNLPLGALRQRLYKGWNENDLTLPIGSRRDSA